MFSGTLDILWSEVPILLAWWFTPVIPALGSLTQDDYERALPPWDPSTKPLLSTGPTATLVPEKRCHYLYVAEIQCAQP
jgi:hypothetical protein